MSSMGHCTAGSPKLWLSECHRGHECSWPVWKLFAWFLQERTSCCRDFAPKGTRPRGGLGAHKDGHASIDILMRFRANQDARLTKAELLMHEMSAEVYQLIDFEEGSWCNIGVRQQRCYGFGNKDSTPGALHFGKASF